MQILTAPYRIPHYDSASNPFRANREALRNPGGVPTSRRWQQEARLLLSEPTVVASGGLLSRAPMPPAFGCCATRSTNRNVRRSCSTGEWTA